MHMVYTTYHRKKEHEEIEKKEREKENISKLTHVSHFPFHPMVTTKFSISFWIVS